MVCRSLTLTRQQNKSLSREFEGSTMDPQLASKALTLSIFHCTYLCFSLACKRVSETREPLKQTVGWESV